MSTLYYRRYRMEIRLDRGRFTEAILPEGYFWLPWHPSLLERHARTKRDAFAGTIDARIFPNLRDIAGCRRLMEGIVNHEAFAPQATWLLAFDDGIGPPRDCGTIQGLALSGGVGTIQNVGIVPEHRGLGLGRALVLQSLAGFHAVRMKTARLEVTADNRLAVRLYHEIGFRLVRTLCKEVSEDETATAFADRV